jgi:hypothetical protein
MNWDASGGSLLAVTCGRVTLLLPGSMNSFWFVLVGDLGNCKPLPSDSLTVASLHTILPLLQIGQRFTKCTQSGSVGAL